MAPTAETKGRPSGWAAAWRASVPEKDAPSRPTVRRARCDASAAAAAIRPTESSSIRAWATSGNSGTTTRVPVAASAEARPTTRGSSGPSRVMPCTSTTVRRAPVPGS
ncbi:MAG: hypothetical protein USCGTAYLOR_02259 [Chromatiales bacterium USCg_Taylor]|nr:MAG: hypothetical protein USCGTAYLOR_02259 [Chromatiales bacterium USCg_Taylor]